MVSLHSHSSGALTIIVAAGLIALANAVPAAFGLQTALTVLYALSLAWKPVYVPIMQRGDDAGAGLTDCTSSTSFLT